MSDKALPPLPPSETTPSTDRPHHPTRTLSESDRFISDFTSGTIIQSAPPSYLERSDAASTVPKYIKRPVNYLGIRSSSITSRFTASQTTLDDRSSLASSAEDSEREYDDADDDNDDADEPTKYPASTLAPSEEDQEDDANELEWNDENKDKARTWMAGGEGGETRVDMRDDGRIDIELSVSSSPFLLIPPST